MAEPMGDTRRVLSPELASDLRRVRLATGLGLLAAARRIKTDHAYLHALEAGRRCPSQGSPSLGFLATTRRSGCDPPGCLTWAAPVGGHTRQSEETWSYEH